MAFIFQLQPSAAGVAEKEDHDKLLDCRMCLPNFHNIKPHTSLTAPTSVVEGAVRLSQDLLTTHFTYKFRSNAAVC